RPDTATLRIFLSCGRSGGTMLSRGRLLLPFPADADELRDAGLLHGDAIEHAPSLHCLAVVGDNDELRLRAHVPDQACEPPDVRLIEWRIDFVQDAEGTRLVTEDGDQQRQRGHGLLAALKQQNVLQALSRWRCYNVNH